MAFFGIGCASGARAGLPPVLAVALMLKCLGSGLTFCVSRVGLALGRRCLQTMFRRAVDPIRVSSKSNTGTVPIGRYMLERICVKLVTFLQFLEKICIVNEKCAKLKIRLNVQVTFWVSMSFCGKRIQG